MTPEAERKRLAMRSWRRGMREMDLLLGPFADAELAGMDAAALADYARLLEESDQDLYAWVIAASRGEAGGPPQHAALISRIAKGAPGQIGKN